MAESEEIKKQKKEKTFPLLDIQSLINEIMLNVTRLRENNVKGM